MGSPTTGEIYDLGPGESPRPGDVPLTAEQAERLRGMSLGERIEELKRGAARWQEAQDGQDALSAEGFDILYPVGEDTLARLHNSFHYHAPHGDQAARHNYLGDLFEKLALVVARLTPGSREQALALTALEEAKMWASAAIARNEKPSEL
jgi:hypothetical protein